MKNKNVVWWFSLAGGIVLIAVLSLFAQSIKSAAPVAEEIPAIPPVESAVAGTNLVPYVPAEQAEKPPIAEESSALAIAGSVAPATTAPTPGLSSSATAPSPQAPAVASAPGETPSSAASAAAPSQMPIATLMVEETNAAAKAEEGGKEDVDVPVRTNQSNLISIALDEVPLIDVVRMFTRISGANIIASASNLHGTVTVNIQDVEWKPALDSILSMHNLALIETAAGTRIYTIAPKAVGQAEPLAADTIFLSYSAVSNVMPVVSAIIGTGGSVVPFASGNALVVKTTAANILDIKRIIQAIDKPRKQVYIEAKFLELTDQAIKDLGINWQVLQGYKIGVGGMNIAYRSDSEKVQGNANTARLSDNRGYVDQINQRYDIYGQPYQETVTTYTPIPGTDPIQYVPSTQVTPTRNVTDTIDQSRKVEQAIEDSFTKNVTDVRTAVLSADDFALVLSALKTLTGVSIVSNPKVIVANDETASIHIGNNEPNIKGEVTPGQQGQANSTTYALDENEPYFMFGITLEVTPTINSDSNITVRINPTLSRKVEDKVAPDKNTFPVTSTKTIKTVFSLDNGKTAAIGGLTETQDRQVVTKIPLLGDIPIIGTYLFSHTHMEKSQNETIIFVTVGLVNPSTVDKNTGLPEISHLVHRHSLADQVLKQKNAAELLQLQKNAEKEMSKAAAKAKK